MIRWRPFRRSPDIATFDPARATVAEVKGYIAAHPEDAERVLAAERAGKNRKGVVGGV